MFLSHLIFEGTLDRFPGLKICGAHAGGYLPSYTGRSDALCGRGGGFGDDCRSLERRPSEYFRSNFYIDAMIFREAGLGLNPASDGQTVRVPVPELSAERREERLHALDLLLGEMYELVEITFRPLLALLRDAVRVLS